MTLRTIVLAACKISVKLVPSVTLRGGGEGVSELSLTMTLSVLK